MTKIFRRWQRLNAAASGREAPYFSAGRLTYRKLQGRPSGFDAAYMMFVGLSAHKIASIESMQEVEDLDLHDRRILSASLVDEIAAMSPEELLARVSEIQERAKRIALPQEEVSLEGP